MKTLKNLEVKFEDVLTVYSGKHGCMCGCIGKYKASELNRELAGKDRGYAYDDNDVSDIAVKRMVNKFNRIGEVSIDIKPDGTVSDHVFIETETRINCIYLKKGTMKNIKI